ncbi:unnamed protein product [Amoebophrya sp. A120]|nr:unnamed protein product [Amoebophrya sp. A120]|eukprot:GSA120T00009737001.1
MTSAPASSICSPKRRQTAFLHRAAFFGAQFLLAVEEANAEMVVLNVGHQQHNKNAVSKKKKLGTTQNKKSKHLKNQVGHDTASKVAAASKKAINASSYCSKEEGGDPDPSYCIRDKKVHPGENFVGRQDAFSECVLTTDVDTDDPAKIMELRLDYCPDEDGCKRTSAACGDDLSTPDSPDATSPNANSTTSPSATSPNSTTTAAGCC